MAKKPDPLAELMARTMNARKGVTTNATPKQVPVQEPATSGLKEVPREEAASFNVDLREEQKQSANSNPFIVPQSQTLMGSATAVDNNPLVSDSHVPDEVGSVHALANLDTDEMGLEPKARRTKSELVLAAQEGKRITLGTERDVRDLCDSIDDMIGDLPALRGPALSVLRNSVMTLMVTLKSNPEFDSVMLGKDVHNVMAFIRSTREEALAMREVKVTKKATSKAKADSKPVNKLLAKVDMSAAFDQMMAGGFGKK